MAFITSTSVADMDVFLSDLMSFSATNAGFTNLSTVLISGENLYRISRTTDTVTTYWGFLNNDPGGTGSSFSANRAQGRIMHVTPDDTTWGDAASGAPFSTNMGCFNLRGPFTRYYFFTDGIRVFAVLEVRPGIYTHLSFGDPEKFGTWPAGSYITANNARRAISGGFAGRWPPPNDSAANNTQFIFTGRDNSTDSSFGRSFFRIANTPSSADYAGLAVGNNWGNMPPKSTFVNGSGDPGAFGELPMLRSPNTFNLRSPIFPLFFFTLNTVTGRYYPRAQIPNIGFINMERLTPGTLVDTSWRVFPLHQKTGDDNIASVSGVYGVAYREIP